MDNKINKQNEIPKEIQKLAKELTLLIHTIDNEKAKVKKTS